MQRHFAPLFAEYCSYMDCIYCTMQKVVLDGDGPQVIPIISPIRRIGWTASSPKGPQSKGRTP